MAATAVRAPPAGARETPIYSLKENNFRLTGRYRLAILHPQSASRKVKVMGVPKRKTSRSRKGNRRSHDHVAAAKPVLCPNCGEARLPHRVCPECGHYDGEEVIKPKEE